MTSPEKQLLCDRFKVAWQNGESPRLENYLADSPAADVPSLFPLLLAVEIEYRFSTGEAPSREQYDSRFPEHLEQIATVFNEFQHQRRLDGDFRSLTTTILKTADVVASGEVPDFVGPYKVVEQIGKGGMGQVFLAEQTDPIKRRVALKVIQPALLEAYAEQSAMFRARFEAERQALAMMEHPNIARVYEAGVHQGCPFLAMEFIDGKPINKYCDEHQLDVRERLQLFRQACQAVQHAHTKGVIHRDIKPQNILVTEIDGKPNVKVIDFGLARASHEAVKLSDNTITTVEGAVLGTWAYMSPEQARGRSEEVDTRSDVYSLGVLLYELLTGETPLSSSAMGATERIKAICDDDPPIPSRRTKSSAGSDKQASRRGSSVYRLSSVLRGDLDWVTMRAIEKERDRRYQSPQELEADIARHLCDEPVLAGPPSWTYRLRKLAKRNPVASLIIVSGLSTVLLISGFLYRQIGLEKAAETARADQQTARADEQKARAVEQAALANAAEQKRLLAEKNLLSQLTPSIQLLNSEALDTKLLAIDAALQGSVLTAASRATVALYKFDLQMAAQRFEAAYETLENIDPITAEQNAQYQLRRVSAADDPKVRTKIIDELQTLAQQLSPAEKYFVEAISLPEPIKRIPLLRQSLKEDASLIECRYQLGIAYCLTGQTDNLRRLCEVNRSVYPASPFFDVLQGFGAAFDSEPSEMESCLSRINEALSESDTQQLRAVMDIILRVSTEVRELEHGMPNSLSASTLLSTLGQLERIDSSSPAISYLTRQLSLGNTLGDELPAASVLFQRWTLASGQYAVFGKTGGYESLLNDIEQASPIAGDLVFSYPRSVFALQGESWDERVARQEAMLEQPSVVPALKSEVMYLLHLSQRGLFQETSDTAVLQAATETLRAWLLRRPQLSTSRLKTSIDTALAADDTELAELLLAEGLKNIPGEDPAVLECNLRIYIERQAYFLALELAERILEDGRFGPEDPLRELAEKAKERALAAINQVSR